MNSPEKGMGRHPFPCLEQMLPPGTLTRPCDAPTARSEVS